MGEARAAEKTASPARQAKPVARQSPASSMSALDEALAPQDRLGNAALNRLLRAGILHPKLEVSEPDDPQELQAEWIAEHLVSPRALHATVGAGGPHAVQRTCASCTAGTPCEECEEAGQPLIQRREDRTRPEGGSFTDVTRVVSELGPGEPLDRSVRRFFEPGLGRDLADVRVHTSTPAEHAARKLQAEAFTVGTDIAFAQGRFAPGTPEGKHLLAHELTHVVQQRVDRSSGTAFRQTQTTPTATPAAAPPGRPYPPLYWGKEGPRTDLLVLPRNGATLEDVAEFLYGTPTAVAELASVNGIDSAAPLASGTALRLTGQTLTEVALKNLKSSRLMPVGFGDPDLFFAKKRLLDVLLDLDFNFIVQQIDENLAYEAFGGRRNEGTILSIFQKWGEEKFTEFPWMYPDGGDYLDRLFSKLTNKTKILEGLFTDQWTNYYSLLFNHFGRVDELIAIRDRYSRINRGDSGLEEVTFGSVLWDDLASGKVRDRIFAYGRGLLKGAWSGLKGTAKFAYTLVTDPKQAISDLAKVPGALKTLWSKREELLDQFLNADPERQAEMIGELFGQIEFAIASSAAGSAASQGISKLAQAPGMLGKAAKVADIAIKLPSKVLGGATKVAKTIVVRGVAFAAEGAMWAARGILRLAGKILRGTWSVVEETVGAITTKLYYFYDEAAGVLQQIEERIASLFVKCKSPCNLTGEAEQLEAAEQLAAQGPRITSTAQLSASQNARLDRIADFLEQHELDWSTLGFRSNEEVSSFFAEHASVEEAVASLESRAQRAVDVRGSQAEHLMAGGGASPHSQLTTFEEPLSPEQIRWGESGLAGGGEHLPRVGADWLSGASARRASMFPSQIAARMRGMAFGSWRDFRETFWRMVADDPVLSQAFSRQNVARMMAGRAPFAVGAEATGGGVNAVYQLNHIRPLEQGGGLFDLSNIEIVTPRFHVSLGAQ